MSDPDLQVGDQIVEVNGVDFTSVDHKEVSLLNESVGFCYHERLFYMFFQTCCSRKKQSVSGVERPEHISRSRRWAFLEVLQFLFSSSPGCEGPEEQQKSDHYCPDRSCKYAAMTTAVWSEFCSLNFKKPTCCLMPLNYSLRHQSDFKEFLKSGLG